MPVRFDHDIRTLQRYQFSARHRLLRLVVVVAIHNLEPKFVGQLVKPFIDCIRKRDCSPAFGETYP